MTVIRPNGISGITSITSSGDAINFYKSDGTLGPVLGLNINATSGISTFAALNVTGVLTYEDVTSVDSVGIITARSDLSIADKIIHTGDTNTAIRFPAADTITAETSGSERLRIDSSGKVIIGTTTAATDAEVTVRAAAPQLSLYATPGGISRLTLGDTDDHDIGIVGYDNSDNTMFFNVNAATRAIIDSSGRLLLGTATEGYSTSDDLTIATSGSTGMTIRSGTSNYGSIHFSDATSGTGEYAGVIEYSHANDSLAFYTSATTRLTLDSSGRLLLGTTTEGHSSGNTLTLAGSGHAGITIRSGTSSYGSIFFSDGTSGSSEYIGSFQYNHNGNFFTLGANGSESLRIDSSGRLLVGCTSQSLTAKFVIQGQTDGANVGGYMRIQTATSVTDGHALGTISFGDASHNGANIQARGDMNWSPFGKGTNLRFSTTSQSSTQPSERMRITSSGNVGINETNPIGDLSITGANGSTMEFQPDVVSGTNRLTNFNRSTSTYKTFRLDALYHEFLTGGTERMRLTSNGVLNVGGDYTQTTSLVHLTGGNSGGGQSTILTLKHPNTTSTGDGPALLLNGYYSSNPWSFAKITSVNSGSGFGADLQIHVHPANGSQGASLVKAVSILGDGGSGANVTITDGNLKIGTSGHGIDFSAHGNTSGMSSELLDDYEEGTWTPVLRSGTNTISYSLNNGKFSYTKIGRTVTVNFTMNGATTSGTTGGDFIVEGLPFTAMSTQSNRFIGGIINFYNLGLQLNNFPAYVHLNANESKINAYYKPAYNAAYDAAHVSSVGSNSFMQWQITYFTD